MALDVRLITDDDVPAWAAAVNTGFLNPVAGELDAEARRPSLHMDRTWAGFDGDRVVATLRSFPTPLTVPGGAQPVVSALTAVTTTATHRRRGLASRMVVADLEASKERGEPASILVSAEWPIYGRYGYGPASEHQTVRLNTGHARFRERPQGTVEYVDRDTARRIAPGVYERHRARRAGEIGRTDRYWDVLFDLVRYESWPEPKPGLYVVARDPDATPVGVVRYRNEDHWEHGQPRGEIGTQMFVTDGPLGEALIWQHLIDLDYATSAVVEGRPADDLLPWLLVDGRDAAHHDRLDFHWLRPLDVPALLTARSYDRAERLVIEFVDRTGLAAGRYLLDAGPDGSTCVASGAAADLTMPVGSLASAYLGGFPVGTLHAAGLVDEDRPGAVDRADALFRTARPPWSMTAF